MIGRVVREPLAWLTSVLVCASCSTSTGGGASHPSPSDVAADSKVADSVAPESDTAVGVDLGPADAQAPVDVAPAQDAAPGDAVAADAADAAADGDSGTVACSGSLECADGNPCTTDTCEAGACVHLGAGGNCDDGDACTSGDACSGTVCLGTPKICNDSNPCTKDACTGGTCTSLPDDGTVCDDGNACTQLDTCQAGDCVGSSPIACTTAACHETSQCDTGTGSCTKIAKSDGVTCDDGNACTAGDACESGACVGATKACDDNNLCTTDSCIAASGCQHDVNALGCDDGNPCTTGELCAAGQCVGGSNSCQCQVDGDCQASEDGNACNGSLVCVKGVCVVNAGSVVICPTGDDSPCSKNKCVATSGLCVQTAVMDGTDCNDGTLCTLSDVCKAGVCGGKALTCEDGNACTADACDPAQGCTHAAIPGVCDDDDACTTAEVCTDGTCGGGVKTDCSDDAVCTDDLCNAKTGCSHVNNSAACDDANPCTSGEACSGGSCGGGKSVCMCQKNLDCKPFEDGDACNGTLVCSGNTCVVDAATVVTCSSAADTACTQAACDPASGSCTPTFVQGGTACDDGSACTTGDACAGGVCTGKTLDCSDANQCTTDSCDVSKGCLYAKGSGACDDGQTCTTGDSCSDGVCKGSSLWWAKGFVGPIGVGGTSISVSLANAVTATDTAILVAGDYVEVIAAQSQTTRGWLFAVDASGQALWSTKVVDDGSLQAIATDGTRVAFAGHYGAGGGVGRATTQGAVQWSKPLGTDGSLLNAVALLKDGQIAAGDQFGVGANATSADGWLVRTGEDGSVLWQKMFGGTGADVLHAIAVVGDTVALAGTTTVNGAGDGWLVLTDTNGNLASQHAFGGEGSQGFGAIAALADGWLLAGSTRPVGQSADTYLVRTDAGGAELWHQSFGQADIDESLSAILPWGSGLAAVGASNPDSSAASIALFNSAGTLESLSSIAVPGGDHPKLGALIPWHNDVVAVGASSLSGGKALVVRANPWGQTTCGDLCVGKKSQDCDDGNPCTSDVCDPSVGCKSSAAGVCEDNNACTTDSCTATGACNHATKDCDDGLACTVDTCDSSTGTCGHTAKSCDDGLPCTTDACDPVSGACANKSKDCNDNLVCTEDSCVAATGVCLHGVACDDANACTNDTCGSSGCVHLAVADNTTCDDGNSCTVSDVCAGGSCAAGAPTLWSALYSGAGDERLGGLAALADGAVFVGSTTSKGAGASDAWLVRVGADGQAQVDATYGGSANDAASAVVAQSDGFAFAGSNRSVASDGASWLVRTDAKGAVVWNKTFDVAGKWDVFFALAPLGDGWVAAGINDSVPRAVRIDSSGAAVWDKTFSSELNGRFQSVLPVADGLLLAGAGIPKSSGLSHMCLIMTDPNGVQQWEKHYGTTSSLDLLYQVLPWGDGYGLIGMSGNPSKIWYARTDAAGTTLWQHTLAASASLAPSAVVTASNSLLITSNTYGSFFLNSIGSVGEVQWSQTFGSDQPLSAPVLVQSGTTLTIGAAVPQNANGLSLFDARLWRLDPWANASCATSAGCALQGAAGCSDNSLCTVDTCTNGTCSHASDSCDDGNPCTTDSCGLVTGCANVAVTDGTTCSDGNLCTIADSCKSGTCTAGPPNACADGIACTNDYCNSGDGSCGHAPVNSNCQDGNSCTANVCNADSGCQFPAITGSCNDGNDCTTGDVCDKGACVGGAKEVDGLYQSGICTIAGGCAYCSSGIAVTCNEAAMQYSVGSVTMVACVPDYPSWGIQPLTPSALTDNGDGTVSDGFTHLMWTKDVDSSVGYVCSNTKLGGFGDWREPSRTELYSIVDWNAVVAADTYSAAMLVAPLAYHSASGPPNAGEWTGFGSGATKWVIGFTNGASSLVAGSGSSKAAERCVRVLQPETIATNRFTVNASAGTVLDTVTLLTWTQAEASGSLTTQSAASAYCTALGTDGGGWRLPNIRELASIVDSRKTGPAIDGVAFPGAATGDVPTWSSTPTCASCNTFAVDFTSGANVVQPTATAAKVRCVR